jgi:hypothetical protein
MDLTLLLLAAVVETTTPAPPVRPAEVAAPPPTIAQADRPAAAQPRSVLPAGPAEPARRRTPPARELRLSNPVTGVTCTMRIVDVGSSMDAGILGPRPRVPSRPSPMIRDELSPCVPWSGVRRILGSPPATRNGAFP